MGSPLLALPNPMTQLEHAYRNAQSAPGGWPNSELIRWPNLYNVQYMRTVMPSAAGRWPNSELI